MSHTPGPWYVESWEEGGLKVLCVKSLHSIFRICNIPGNQGLDRDEFNIPELEEEAEVNARLIAAAPALLEACRKAYQDLVGTDGADWQIAQLTLREAIFAAAEGK